MPRFSFRFSAVESVRFGWHPVLFFLDETSSWLGFEIFYLKKVYIFVGSILLHDHVLRIIAGSIVGIIGIIYVVLEFIPSIEPPANMRYNEWILPHSSFWGHIIIGNWHLNLFEGRPIEVGVPSRSSSSYENYLTYLTLHLPFPPSVPCPEDIMDLKFLKQ